MCGTLGWARARKCGVTSESEGNEWPRRWARPSCSAKVSIREGKGECNGREIRAGSASARGAWDGKVLYGVQDQEGSAPTKKPSYALAEETTAPRFGGVRGGERAMPALSLMCVSVCVSRS